MYFIYHKIKYKQNKLLILTKYLYFSNENNFENIAFFHPIMKIYYNNCINIAISKKKYNKLKIQKYEDKKCKKNFIKNFVFIKNHFCKLKYVLYRWGLGGGYSWRTYPNCNFENIP